MQCPRWPDAYQRIPPNIAGSALPHAIRVDIPHEYGYLDVREFG